MSTASTNRRIFLPRGAADVDTASPAFVLLESIRPDLGAGSQIQP